MPCTAFAASKGKAITARLIVRRVKDLNRKASQGQDELFAIWRYHALFTDSPVEMIQAEAHHRDHAIPRAGVRGPDQRPLGSPAIGQFPANAAWLALAAICHNLTRAAGIARHGCGHITMHLPEGWHRQTAWMSLFQAACDPPAAAA